MASPSGTLTLPERPLAPVRGTEPRDPAKFDILTVNSLPQSTITAYVEGLAPWIAWCDLHGVPEAERLPVSTMHFVLFLAYLGRSHSHSLIQQIVIGLHGWHKVKNLPWNGPFAYGASVSGAAQILAPPSVKQLRAPVTLMHLQALHSRLSFSNTFDCAVYATATTAFWGLCRLGELTIPSLTTFDSTRHISRRTHMESKSVPDRGRSIFFRIPWSKTTHHMGAQIMLVEESHCTDPLMALDHHILVNAAVPSSHGLFSYMEQGTPKYMTRAHFLDRCTQTWLDAGLPPIHNPSFRMGGAVEHLRRGLSLDYLQVQGRWTSKMFRSYIIHLGEALTTGTAAIDVNPSVS